MFGRTHNGTGSSGASSSMSSAAGNAVPHTASRAVIYSTSRGQGSGISQRRDRSLSGDSYASGSSVDSSSDKSLVSWQSIKETYSSGGAASSHLSSRLQMAAPSTDGALSVGLISADRASVAGSVISVAQAPRHAERIERIHRRPTFMEELNRRERDARAPIFGDILAEGEYPDHMRRNFLLYRRAEEFGIKLPKISVDAVNNRFTTEIRFMVPSRLADAVEMDLKGRIEDLELPVKPRVFQRKYGGAISPDGLRYACFTYIPEIGKPVVMNYIDIKLHVTHLNKVGDLLNTYFNEMREQEPRADIFKEEILSKDVHTPSGSNMGPWTGVEIKNAWISSYESYLDIPDAIRSVKSTVRERYYSFRTKFAEERAIRVAERLVHNGIESKFLRQLKPENLAAENRYLAIKVNRHIRAREAERAIEERERRLAEIRVAEDEREAREAQRVEKQRTLEAEEALRHELERLKAEKEKIRKKRNARGKRAHPEQISGKVRKREDIALSTDSGSGSGSGDSLGTRAHGSSSSTSGVVNMDVSKGASVGRSRELSASSGVVDPAAASYPARVIVACGRPTKRTKRDTRMPLSPARGILSNTGTAHPAGTASAHKLEASFVSRLAQGKENPRSSYARG